MICVTASFIVEFPGEIHKPDRTVVEGSVRQKRCKCDAVIGPAACP